MHLLDAMISTSGGTWLVHPCSCPRPSRFKPHHTGGLRLLGHGQGTPDGRETHPSPSCPTGPSGPHPIPSLPRRNLALTLRREGPSRPSSPGPAEPSPLRWHTLRLSWPDPPSVSDPTSIGRWVRSNGTGEGAMGRSRCLARQGLPGPAARGPGSDPVLFVPAHPARGQPFPQPETAPHRMEQLDRGSGPVLRCLRVGDIEQPSSAASALMVAARKS